VKYIPEEVGQTAFHVFWNNTENLGVFTKLRWRLVLANFHCGGEGGGYDLLV